MMKKLFFRHKKPLTRKSTLFGERVLLVTASNAATTSATNCTRTKPSNRIKRNIAFQTFPEYGMYALIQYRTCNSKDSLVPAMPG